MQAPLQQIKFQTKIPSDPNPMEASESNAENCSTKSNSPESASSVQTKDMDFKGQLTNYSVGQMFVKENTGYIKDFYNISSSIGKGAFGEVRKCLHKESKALRAVKIINKKPLQKRSENDLLGRSISSKPWITRIFSSCMNSFRIRRGSSS